MLSNSKPTNTLLRPELWEPAIDYVEVETPLSESERTVRPFSTEDEKGEVLSEDDGKTPKHWLTAKNVVAVPRKTEPEDNLHSKEGLLRTLAYDEKLDSEKSVDEIEAEKEVEKDEFFIEKHDPLQNG